MLLMLMAIWASPARAATNPTFSGTATGSVNNLTLNATLGIADSDVGKNGNIYLGLAYQNNWFFNSGGSWTVYRGGAIPIYAVTQLSNRTVEIVRNIDASQLIGGEVYAGYGLSENDMLANGKYGLVYRIVANTTAPTVLSSVIPNGASGVSISTSIGATFSVAMNPATLNSNTVMLMQGATPVPGTVSYSGVNVVFLPDNPLINKSTYTATIKGGSNGAKDLAGTALVSDFVWSWTTGTPLAPVLLGTAGNFAVLSKTGISSVPASTITGDIGVSPAAATYITGFSLVADASNVFSTSTQVVGGGKVYAANMAVPTPSNLTTAILDMQNAYTDAAGRPTPDFLNLGAGNIGGLTLTPGLYNWGSSVTIPTDLVLSGGPNDVWILQMSGDLAISANKHVSLSGGALAKNVFWQVSGRVTMSAGAHFEGNILSQTSVTMQTGASMNGRLLAQTAVALDSATISKPAP